MTREQINQNTWEKKTDAMGDHDDRQFVWHEWTDKREQKCDTIQMALVSINLHLAQRNNFIMMPNWLNRLAWRIIVHRCVDFDSETKITQARALMKNTFHARKPNKQILYKFRQSGIRALAQNKFKKI